MQVAFSEVQCWGQIPRRAFPSQSCEGSSDLRVRRWRGHARLHPAPLSFSPPHFGSAVRDALLQLAPVGSHFSQPTYPRAEKISTLFPRGRSPFPPANGLQHEQHLESRLSARNILCECLRSDWLPSVIELPLSPALYLILRPEEWYSPSPRSQAHGRHAGPDFEFSAGWTPVIIAGHLLRAVRFGS